TVEKLWQCFDVGRAINPTLVEGQIEGGALMGLGLAVLEQCYPYYPSVEHRGSEFGSYLAPGIEGLPEINTIVIENPSEGGPFGFREGVNIRAIGGEQVLVCSVEYDPGFGVPTHSHEHTEQVMVVTDGELELTVEGETRTLRAGDTAVINRGVEHAVRTENGC